MKNIFAFLSLLLIISGCKQSSMKDSRALQELFNNYYEERLGLYPLEATAIADHRYDDVLPCDISENYREKLRTFYKKYQENISHFDRTKLLDEDMLSYDVFKREMDMQLEGLTFNDYLMPVNQFWGMPITFAQLGSGGNNQPFKTVQDYDRFIGRMKGYSIWTDTAIANMKRGMQMNVVPPRVLMEKVLPQLKAMLVQHPEESVFYTPVKNIPSSIGETDRIRIDSIYKENIMRYVVSSYQKLYDFISTEYIYKCRNNAGISEIPGGKEYYAYEARLWTTTKMTPDEIYAVGLKEVKRLHDEMEKIKVETGYQGDLKSFFHFLHSDKQFMPFTTDSEVIQAYHVIQERMQPQLTKLFNLVPKAKFEIHQTEKFREASSSAEYIQSAPDGSRPGIFFVPIPDAKKFNTFGMEDLFLHEAIPGHHYQTALQQENESLPKFRRFGWYGAYGEGWALYSESLGTELGLYKDPYQHFGCLSEEMHRAIRLVVDVGMHMKGMSREEAIRYSLENEAESEGDITIEIERYMAIPGQALGYKIGQMKIIEIRMRAASSLGSKFNIQRFHDEVLRFGCLPLDVFEKKMNEWIKAQR